LLNSAKENPKVIFVKAFGTKKNLEIVFDSLHQRGSTASLKLVYIHNN